MSPKRTNHQQNRHPNHAETMGQILSQPVTEKHSEQGSNLQFAYGLSAMQGWRISMEDAHTTVLNLHNLEGEDGDRDDSKPIAFFAVYDGHGGDRTAKFAGGNLYKILKDEEEFKKGNYGQALKNSFLNADREILKIDDPNPDQSGCTATAILIDDTKVVCANAGDSRTVLSVNGHSKPLSYDHKPTNEGEYARICAAGGFVDIGRVNGNLALSRAIGDFDFKKSTDLPPEEQIVTAFPDVIEHEITKDDEFVVLACDGIWDCLTSQQVVEIVRKGIHDKLSLVEISEALIDICLAPTSKGSGIGCDNMSVVIVAILNGQTEEEWRETIIKKGGPVSGSFEAIANEIYSEEERARGFQVQAAQQLPSEAQQLGDDLKTSFSINQLLEHNILTSQNGVFYLDSANLLNTLNGGGESILKEEDNEDQDNTHTQTQTQTITEIDEEEEEKSKDEETEEK